jgi:Ca2+-binding RTX toxin-like protein
MIDVLNGSPSGDVAPLAAPDLRLSGSVGVKGEVDKLVFSLTANTTYTFEMLGISSGKLPNLTSWQVLADPKLKLVGPSGTIVAANDDAGLGLDAHATFTTTQAGLYTIELSGVGSATGAYRLQADNITVQNDIYRVSTSSTLVVEGAGGGNDRIYSSANYTLAAGSSIETLSTNSSIGTVAINLTGNELSQSLIGNSGSNVLDGKGGIDVLTGLGGSDTFAFSSKLGTSNVDQITDFSAAADSIWLDDAVFSGLAAGPLSAGAFKKGAAATDADDRIVFDPLSRKLYFDPDGSGGAAQVHFATIAGPDLNLSSADFVVI